MRFDAMVILATLFLGVVMILYLPVFFILRKRGVGLARQLSYLLLAWSFFLILLVTLTPMNFSPEHRHLNLQPFTWLATGRFSQLELMESIGNILMFIPLGILIPAVFKKARKFYLLITMIFVVTLSIEFIQYFTGRVADIDDVIENTLGGAIGYGIFMGMNKLFISQTWWQKLIGINDKK